MTPDPIATAREAERSILKSINQNHAISLDDLSRLTAALDYAEKLKAERDAWKETADAREALIIRRTADRDRLTSQLEQAERVIAPFVDENEAQVEERPASVKDSDRPYMFYRATYADLAALSQWIKDRQEKQALAELHTEEKHFGLE